MSHFAATVVLDSVSPAGARLTTMELRYPRFIHAQLLTHRAFSRNSQSSRAVPVSRLLDAVRSDPYLPTVAMNRRGMVAGDGLPDAEQRRFESELRQLASDAATLVQRWSGRVHKQWLNRYLEPWLPITTIVSATDWGGFFKLRCADDAQPEMQTLATMMRDARDASVPVRRVMHCPYREDSVVRSVAACARVSYLTHDGKDDAEADERLYKQLAEAPHASPFEHVAEAWPGRWANYDGWRSLRNQLGY